MEFHCCRAYLKMKKEAGVHIAGNILCWAWQISMMIFLSFHQFFYLQNGVWPP